jgi:hypothetical protein
VKPFVPTIDRADLITEADLDEEPCDNDNMDTGDSLEDIDDLIILCSTEKYSRDSDD